ncbi:hypothetical protein [Planomonospora parontospora]|uniref:hypothetical protein n=1 Tax=Planomonospora parontospora TaxID=58119 RepID=UPI001670AC02|nr:hypothetical protein [Planomonospora parontospora]GGL31059.1 hypothetical protein GCM10014719_35630 [Planomonospora parontospora subsp. antibiotica]GII16624.1 hypothetical protein Ppa05_33500 [Planomonospora parontospora subsp. antibiotica]
MSFPLVTAAGTEQEFRYRTPTDQGARPRKRREARPVPESMSAAQVIRGPWALVAGNSESLRGGELPAPHGEAYDREYVSHLWAADWDCPEDAVYDDL